MSRSTPTKVEWFDLGVAGIGAGLRVESEDGESLEGCYACPICFRFFYRAALASGDLTFEHAPPESVGGKRVALTCHDCNGDAGRTVDAQAAVEKRLIDGLAGHRPLDVEIRNVRARVHLHPDVVHITIDQRRNNPSSVGALFEDARRRGSELDLAWTARERFDQRRVRLSYLRSAYLIAFARFGYRMVAGPGFVPARRQVRFLDRVEMEILPVLKRPDWNEGLHEIRHPALGQSLGVSFGNWSVLLPFHADDEDWYNRYVEEATSPTHQLMMSPQPMLWPTKPMHQLDHHPWDLPKDRPVDLFREESDVPD